MRDHVTSSMAKMAAPTKSLSTVILLKLICLIGFCSPQDLPTLRLVNLLYRHGDRSPVSTYPTNPIPESAWPQGYGQLTEEGMRQHYHLGQFYREYYKTFLNGSYDRYQISVRSSNLDRCLISGECHLAGLYPPAPQGSAFLPNISWQPVPIHTQPEDTDSVLALRAPCPAYTQAFDELLKSEIVKQEEKRNKEFYMFVGNKTGFGHENISNIWNVADTLYCESQHKFDLPGWVNRTVIDKLRTLESFSFTLMFYTTLMRRLKGGPLLKIILENMENKIRGVNGTLDADRGKMYMYSAHDTTVAALLSALGVFNDISPPYAASVILELHEDPANTYYVQVFYNNGTRPLLLTIPGCTEKCPFGRFVNLTAAVIPEDWQQECGLPEDNSSEMVLKFSLLMFGVLIGGFLIVTLLLVLIAIKCVRRSPRTKYSLLPQDYN